jgi:hypothetical protein
MLYRGARLTQAQEWGKTHDDELNALEREFLAVSVEAREREAGEREGHRQRELEAAQKLAEAEKQHARQLSRRASRMARPIWASILRGSFLASLPRA